LLGLALGDAVGAPFEGVPAENIYWQVGLVHDYLKQPSRERLRYTDDTQMAIGVAEVLVECGRIDADRLWAAFARNYEPFRGYGPGTRRVLDAMLAGEPWRELVVSQFPGGSLGNGAAMRVAPVGLLFWNDLDRVWDEAGRSAEPTHTHPIGIEAAQLLAVAVAYAVGCVEWDRKAFYRELLARARTEEMRWAVRTAAHLKAMDSFSVLGNSMKAHQSVGTALACFARTPDGYREVVSDAINLGDDTDTIAAMAGALCGAFLGTPGLPSEWLERLEGGPRGKRYLRTLAGQLFARSPGPRHP
jgi:poly(ADP-ribose) glycohydrolase ARH3